MSNLSCGTHVAEPSANKDCRKLLNQFCRFLPKLKLPISADAKLPLTHRLLCQQLKAVEVKRYGIPIIGLEYTSCRQEECSIHILGEISGIGQLILTTLKFHSLERV